MISPCKRKSFNNSGVFMGVSGLFLCFNPNLALRYLPRDRYIFLLTLTLFVRWHFDCTRFTDFLRLILERLERNFVRNIFFTFTVIFFFRAQSMKFAIPIETKKMRRSKRSRKLQKQSRRSQYHSTVNDTVLHEATTVGLFFWLRVMGERG